MMQSYEMEAGKAMMQPLEMESGANVVFLKDMSFMLPIGEDAWRRKGQTQPVNISLQVENVTTINDAAATDDVGRSVDYGKLYKDVHQNLTTASFFSDVIAVAACAYASIQQPDVLLSGEIDLPKAAMRAEGGFHYRFQTRGSNEAAVKHQTFSIHGIKCAAFIGVNSRERSKKQILAVNTTFSDEPNGENSPAEYALDRSEDIVDSVVEVVEGTAYHTVEALANRICEHLTTRMNIPAAEVSIEKPYAIPNIGGAGVRIRRTRSFYVA